MDQSATTATTTLNTGRAMPVLGLGTWQLTDRTTESVAHALDRGYRMVDTSSDYGRQPAIGEAIRSCGVDRSELRRGVVPLPKASHQMHLETNLDIFDFQIRDQDMDALDGMNERYSSLGSLAYV